MTNVFNLFFYRFGTSKWLVGDGHTPFREFGLFRACFDQCTYPFCPAGDQFIYDGCHKLWDEHYRELWHWLKPDWFEHLRNIAIVLVPLTGVLFFFTVAHALIVCIWRYPRTKTPCRNYSLQVLLVVTAALSLVATILLMAVLGQFSFHVSSKN